MDDEAAQMESMVQADGIDHVFIEFPDLNGLSRSKQLDADYFLDSWERGFTMNLALLTQTPRSDVVPESKYGDEIDYADALVQPDPRTCRRVPWRDDAVRVICDFEFRGHPVAGAPRTVLESVVDQVASFGLDAYVGSELECFLLEPVDGGGREGAASGERNGKQYVPATSDKHENLTRATEEVSPFYDHVYDWASAFDLALTAVHHEFGAGQVEILFEHGRPLGQADRTFRFKELVKHAAMACDQHATFMAKPFTDRAGSGYHCHVSLFDDGENVLAATDPERTDGRDLSERGRHFVGGLLEHADALAALGTPNLNGFKRYQPETFAPYSASWGYGNRMAALRVPAHGTTRIENRISSADANPYLVVAGTLAAGLHGLEAELEPPAPSAGDPSESRPSLPQSPREAITRLETDEILTDYLGEDVIHEYTAMKRQEIEAFYQQTTSWERHEYIEML